MSGAGQPLYVCPGSNGRLILDGDFAAHGAVPLEPQSVQTISLALIGQYHLTVFREDRTRQGVTDKLAKF